MTVLEHMLIKCIFGVIVRDHPSLAVNAALSAFYLHICNQNPKVNQKLEYRKINSISIFTN